MLGSGIDPDVDRSWSLACCVKRTGSKRFLLLVFHFLVVVSFAQPTCVIVACLKHWPAAIITCRVQGALEVEHETNLASWASRIFLSQGEKWNFPSVLWTWNLTFHWPFSTNPVEDRAKCQMCMTFSSILYRIGGEQSMKCQISCPQDWWEISFLALCISPSWLDSAIALLLFFFPFLVGGTRGRENTSGHSAWPTSR